MLNEALLQRDIVEQASSASYSPATTLSRGPNVSIGPDTTAAKIRTQSNGLLTGLATRIRNLFSDPLDHVSPDELHKYLGRGILSLQGHTRLENNLISFPLYSRLARQLFETPKTGREFPPAMASKVIDGKRLYLWYHVELHGHHYQLRVFDPSSLSHGPDAGGAITMKEFRKFEKDLRLVIRDKPDYYKRADLPES